MALLASQNALLVTRERMTTISVQKLRVRHASSEPMLPPDRRLARHVRLVRSTQTLIQDLNALRAAQASTARPARQNVQIVQQEQLIWTRTRLLPVKRATVVNTHQRGRLPVLTVRVVSTTTKGQRQNAEIVE